MSHEISLLFVRVYLDIFDCLIAGDGGDLLFESFDGGEEFEDHHEDEEKSREDDRIDISLDADHGSEGITDGWECHDECHTSPDDDADGELGDGLTTLVLEILSDTLREHEEGDSENDDLIECERHRGRG